jgi:HemY protein
MDEIESAQRREWSDLLASVYGELGAEEAATRLRKAEAWLAIAPNSAALLTTLGRLYALLGQYGKAEEALERALALTPSSAAWEALGDVRRGQNDLAGANAAYGNALRCARGEPTVPLAPLLARGPLDTRPIAFEERSEHGVPRLPLA